LGLLARSKFFHIKTKAALKPLFYFKGKAKGKQKVR
jgi:hypothetical protein